MAMLLQAPGVLSAQLLEHFLAFGNRHQRPEDRSGKYRQTWRAPAWHGGHDDDASILHCRDGEDGERVYSR
jgi:hypothetical protein